MLDSIQHFDLIQLNCEDLKNGLATAVKDLEQMLLVKVASDHRVDNEK
jgi:dynein heavy chain